jgi:DNA modification methylase
MLTPYYNQDGITLYCGDAREILPQLPAGSVDLVLTDPPYPAQYVDLYRALAEESARLCKPGAFVYAYAGAHELPDVLARMTPPLTWFWLFNIRHIQHSPRYWARRLMVTSKPVVICTNGPVSPIGLKWCATDDVSLARSKEHHPWEQSIQFAWRHIELRTEPGALVLDPFVGGGTVLRAAKDTGRRAIGVEIDEAHCATTVRRLAQGVLPLEIA